ncbi:hypothetical protein K474DRAFT_1713476 [Panus rudis PR-1116 ss-1]|nr:hypothetical protein K474DRAFT_1713476 [Panus rudis PR-1116 ss-1]
MSESHPPDAAYTLPQHGVVHVSKNVGTIVFTFQSASGPDIPGIVSHFGDLNSGHKRKRRRSSASDSESSDSSSTDDLDTSGTEQDTKRHAHKCKKSHTCDVCRELLLQVDPHIRRRSNRASATPDAHHTLDRDPSHDRRMPSEANSPQGQGPRHHTSNIPTHTTVEPVPAHRETIPESQDPRNLEGEDVVPDSQTEDEDLHPAHPIPASSARHRR